MSSRKLSAAVLVPVGLTLWAALAVPATAQRRGAPAPKLSDETLVPTEVFAAADAKKLGYADGFDALYTRVEKGHEWKITEAAGATATPAAEASPAGSPTPTPQALGPTADEPEFNQKVGLVRPTLVHLEFTESPEAAAKMVTDYQAAHADESARPQNLVVYELEKDAKVGGNAISYTREYNLGPKGGGMRMASTVVTSKGNAFVRVEAALGLKDGEFEASADRLHERARTIAGYLLKKL